MKPLYFLDKLLLHCSYKYKLHRFQSRINPVTWEIHDRFLDIAFQESSVSTPDHKETPPIVVKGQLLRSQSLQYWGGKYSNSCSVRILIHVPSQSKSPGGFSLFSNIIDCLGFMGVPCCALFFDSDLSQTLIDFKPNVFISSDNAIFINNIDFAILSEYRFKHQLIIGLTAYIQEYGFSSPLKDRLAWAQHTGVDFYYSFRSPEYLNSRVEYKPFYDLYPSIFSIEFGFNPISYYPVISSMFAVPYVFLASSNIDKQDRYRDWLLPIVGKYPGLIDGPGWSRNKSLAPKHIHKHMYARSCIGLNLHIDLSIDYPAELNERTYILAACGVPQLIDNPMLLSKRFSTCSYYSASHPSEYFDLFCHMIEHPDETQFRAIKALEEVFARHTYFHRLDKFLSYLESLLS